MEIRARSRAKRDLPLVRSQRYRGRRAGRGGAPRVVKPKTRVTAAREVTAEHEGARRLYDRAFRPRSGVLAGSADKGRGTRGGGGATGAIAGSRISVGSRAPLPPPSPLPRCAGIVLTGASRSLRR